MSTLGYILLFTFLGSIAALVGGVILLSYEKLALKISHFLASFAAGVLLGSAFLDLLPEALHEGNDSGADVLFWALFGIILFFLIERFIRWLHHHEHQHDIQISDEKETKSTAPLIIIGDTVHNFIDGVIIAATFLVSIPLGIATTIAVAAHEIPQEIGDFGLLLHKGLSKKRVIIVNVASASVSIIGAVITYLLGDIVERYIPILLALTAGFFIYIATSDLIPEIHHEKRKGFAVIESALFIAGIAAIWLSVTLLEHS
jgi:zinc and cadmium transporter